MNQKEIEYRRAVFSLLGSRHALNVLHVLYQSEDAVSTTSLVEKCGVSIPVLTPVLQKLRELCILDTFPTYRDGNETREYSYGISLNASPFVQVLFGQVAFTENDVLNKFLGAAYE